jgi:hypothetical protein
MMPKCKNKQCKKDFIRKTNGQVVCCWQCGIEYAKQNQEKKDKAKKTQTRRELKAFNESDKTVLKRNAQMLINRYARLRDERERGLVCCSCSHRDSGQFDGGHFLPTSGYSAIRYNTNQIHLQCKNCNRFNGGRPKEYRIFMINKYGLEYVEKLEATKNVTRSYSVEYYQKLIRVVRKKLKKMEKML